ncbi:hypothetical protein [Pseudoalteromonas sp. GB56]
MKYLYINGLAVIFLAGMSCAVNAGKLNAFKCYALLEDNKHAVIDVEVKPNSLEAAREAAILEGHKYPQQKNKSVLEVKECVPRTEQFINIEAQELDKIKLR